MSTSEVATTSLRETTPVHPAKTTGGGAINATELLSQVILRSALARRLVSIIIPEAGIMCFNTVKVVVIPDIRVDGLGARTVSYFGSARMKNSDVLGVQLLIMIIPGREIMLLNIASFAVNGI